MEKTERSVVQIMVHQVTCLRVKTALDQTSGHYNIQRHYTERRTLLNIVFSAEDYHKDKEKPISNLIRSVSLSDMKFWNPTQTDV